jgi:cellulose synthase/poly-beta-1,6-N-acetylglucosamine synthase-like glycosyltransferase
MFGLIFWASAVFIFYVYIGYPLAIALLGRLSKPSFYSSNFHPSVTLLFAAHNEEKVLAEKLENCLALEYPRELLQILIVDDGSTDQTVEIAKSYTNQGVELISSLTRRGKLSAQTDALPYVRGEIVLFSDADNFYPSNVLQMVAKYFSIAEIGCVSGGRNVIGGETLLGGSESLYWKYEEFIKLQESRIGNCVGVAGDLLAVRRSLYVPPPLGIINDDFYTGLSVIKQGYRVVYAPDARSYHPVAGTELGEIERRARMVAGRYQAIFSAWKMLPWQNPIAVWQIFSHKYFRPLIPFAMIIALISNFLALFSDGSFNKPSWLMLSSPYQWILLVLQLLFYLSAWIGSRYKFRGAIGKLMYMATFLVNSNAAALRGFYRYITSKQTVMWKKAAR